MRKRFLSTTLVCALSSLFLIANTTVQAFDVIDPTLPYYPEEYYSYHVADKIFFAECMIEIDDGSQWRVADADRAQLISWRANDYLVITPNHYRTDHAFYMTNQVNGSYVRVNLVNGPKIGGHRTMLISGLDAGGRLKRAVHLNNGTSWAIDDADLYIIDNWHIADPIIIGRNDSWFTYNHSLLINVLTNTYVRARKI